MAATPHQLPVERHPPGPPPGGGGGGPGHQPPSHLPPTHVGTPHPHVIPHPVDHGPGPVIPAGGARSTAIAAARAAAAAVPSTVRPWEPWKATIAAAEARYKREIEVALRQLDHATAAAGAILDTAESIAAQVQGQLEAAAWSAWHKYMAEAGRSSQAVLGPALAAYEQAIGEASSEYGKILAEGGRAYRAAIAAADTARAQAAAFPR